MTQFLRVSDPCAKTSMDRICSALGQIEGIDAHPEENGWASVVDTNDKSSAGPLVDDLHNLLSSGGDIPSAAIVRLLHLADEKGWYIDMWYSNDMSDLPICLNLKEAVAELLKQASAQPPEIYLRFQPQS
ncbi:hypothetical protein [Nannocystis sp. SCPEA4]|uniref:hypothetical protein n=1 Tax=Nannocystis sp. SCPEA4 TaxID=2996787 RepID=UPI00226FE743|nr:hypothetical protein [Nannocystis sp. SCPEA4]MCY1056209.1 hypothetical protein [Nannocystis sp. SCPEA4]